MSKFTEMMENCRSIYTLGESLSISKEGVTALVREVVGESPTVFNFQTQRVTFLFDDTHKKLRAMTGDTLKPLTPVGTSPNIQTELQSFAAGAGTILFFEDTDIVRDLQDSSPLYADNFPVWSGQATGSTQANVQTALAQENIGINLQHYNPIIGKAVAAEWSIPASWNLHAQMVIGSIEAPAGEKEYIEDSARFKELN